MRDFPRIMTLLSTVTNITNTTEDQIKIKDDLGLGDVLHKSYDALKTYSRVRNFITIISDRYGLAREIDSFYYHIHHLIISKDEMLEMLSLDYYYKQAKNKLDVTNSRFIELDNEILYETNLAVDQTRGFLAAIDNLRNIADFMYMDFSSETMKRGLGSDDKLASSLAKIDLGQSFGDYVVNLQVRLSNMIGNLGTGVSKVYTVRSDIAKILKKMFDEIPTVKELKEKWAGVYQLSVMFLFLWLIFRE